MKEIRFLAVEEVIEIHTDLIERYGGTHGIRDIGLLQSAVAMPQAGLGDQYLHSDLFSKWRPPICFTWFRTILLLMETSARLQ